MAGTPIRVDIDPTLQKVDRDLATFAALTADLRPFWELLGRSLADESQSRWPLRRRTGKLRRSLAWSGSRLGRSGIFQSKRDKLLYGTRLFYGHFAQHGTKHQPATKLIHVNEDDISARLSAWSIERARAAGFSRRNHDRNRGPAGPATKRESVAIIQQEREPDTETAPYKESDPRPGRGAAPTLDGLYPSPRVLRSPGSVRWRSLR